MGANQSAEEEMTDTSAKLNPYQASFEQPIDSNSKKESKQGPRPSPMGDFRSMPAEAWNQVHARFEASRGKAEKVTSLRASAPEWTPWSAAGHEIPAPYHPPLDAQWSVPLPRQVSTGGQSTGGGQCHTPEAGSRRPSYTPYGPYGAPAAPAVPGYTGDVYQQRVMMEKAFYDGWADAAAAAARAAAAAGSATSIPPSPPPTPAAQVATVAPPVVGGVAASLAAHVQAMPPSPAAQAATAQPLSPAAQVPGIQPISPALSGSQLQMPNTPSQASTGEHVPLDQLQWQRVEVPAVQIAPPKIGPPAGPVAISNSESPRSSILKLCGAWGALAKQNTPKLSLEPGHAKQRAELLHYRRALGATAPPQEVATLTCARV